MFGRWKSNEKFLFIDDCIEAILKLFHSNFIHPINIGSEEKVSINELINIISKISGVTLKKNYQLDKPKGVNGRSSDNTLIKKILDWSPKYSLSQGIEKTYSWIEHIYINRKNEELSRFTKSSLK